MMATLSGLTRGYLIYHQSHMSSYSQSDILVRSSQLLHVSGPGYGHALGYQ